MALINQLLLIISLSLSLLVGAWVLLADKKKKSNRIFFAVAIIIFFWILFGYLGLNYPQWSLIFLKANFCVVSIFFLATYYLTSEFPKRIKRSTIIDLFITIYGIIFSLLSAFSDLIIFSTSKGGDGIQYSMGSFKLIFYAYVIISTLLISKNLISIYYSKNNKIRSQVMYFVIGAFLYAFINVLFNVLMPVIFKVNPSKYLNLGDYSAIFFLVFTAYAIVKHGLFNIKVIATESVVIFLSLGLFVQVFISNSTLEYVLKFIIWALASYGGWLLIKSVKIEIKQREELEMLAGKLADANAHLKDLDKMKDDFLSMASHELNTPLAAIEGYLSMMLEEGMGGDLQPKTREYLDRMYKSSRRLAEIVKDLLNVSRIESGRIHLVYQEVQIEDLIKQSVAEIDSKLKEKGHELCMDLPMDPLPKTWMDITRITEVLINFLGNAIKYTDDGGHLKIGAKKENNNILVWVKDDGRGIPKDKAQGVFEKFTQVDVLKDEVKGTGLGMYISKKFIDLHKGKIWFESEGEGKGTTFFFSLPVCADKPYDPNEGEGPVLR